ncbi:MAG: PrsW family intramembrane metalloprotease [Paludibacteraceae bacterium]|nr:PrsW family intramembrane metalloprotease [Paludibacteraceae bacterium]
MNEQPNFANTDDLLLLIFAGVLPAILIIVYIYIKDKYQREPLIQIVRGFAYGVVAAIIAILLEIVIQWVIGTMPEGWAGAMIEAFVVAAMPEEAAKLLMLYLLLRSNPDFDERFDGIVYATCVGMGFAASENIIYLVAHQVWVPVAMARAIFAVPGHFLFAVAMGYFYSRLYFDTADIKTALAVYFAPVLLHGIYDGLLFASKAEPGWSTMLVIVFYIFFFRMFKFGRKRINEQLERDRQDPTQRAFYDKGD